MKKKLPPVWVLIDKESGHFRGALSYKSKDYVKYISASRVREAVRRERERLAHDPAWIVRRLMESMSMAGIDQKWAAPFARSIVEGIRKGGQP